MTAIVVVLIIMSFINQSMTSNSTGNYTAPLAVENSALKIIKSSHQFLNIKTLILNKRPRIFPGMKKEDKKTKTFLGCMKLNTCF